MQLKRSLFALLPLVLVSCGSGSSGTDGSDGSVEVSDFDLLVLDSQDALCGVMANGSDMTVLKQAADYDGYDYFDQLAVSPDATRLVYAATCGGAWFLRSMGSDLGDPTNLTTPSCGTETASWPAFSPDGTKIAFVGCWYAGENGCYLHLMNADGSNDHRLTPLTDHDPVDASPSFSPDGSHVVFVSDRAATPGALVELGVFTIALDGSGLEALSTDLGLTDSPVPFSVTVDGPRGLVYSVLAQVDVLNNTKNIYRATYPGGSPVIVTNESTHSLERPAVSPDGKLLAFVRDSGSFASGTLEVLDLTTGTITTIDGTSYFGWDEYPVFVPRP